jgi:hypothetical protein
MFQSNAELGFAYNTLFDVYNANLALRRCGLTHALTPLIELIQSSGLEHVVCVRLLHKHNDILASERMVERAFIDAEGFGLSTQACDSTPVGYELLPNTWRLLHGCWIPVEFSDARLLCNRIVGPTHHSSFFSRLADILETYEVADLVGPSIRYSPLVESYRPSSDWYLLERTNRARRANVMRYILRSDVEAGPTIETKWVASPPSAEGRWMANVECACTVVPEGGHTGTHTYIPPGDDDDDDDSEMR